MGHPWFDLFWNGVTWHPFGPNRIAEDLDAIDRLEALTAHEQIVQEAYRSPGWLGSNDDPVVELGNWEIDSAKFAEVNSQLNTRRRVIYYADWVADILRSLGGGDAEEYRTFSTNFGSLEEYEIARHTDLGDDWRFERDADDYLESYMGSYDIDYYSDYNDEDEFDLLPYVEDTEELERLANGAEFHPRIERGHLHVSERWSSTYDPYGVGDPFDELVEVFEWVAHDDFDDTGDSTDAP